ncbi:MAG: RnfABCDGE type electron transport complex subunit D [Oscillospiraceae bacterium]|nr:RnfABCDGE type electron transport complex subunit D [Oscillospiraceae bacterium]
MELSRPLIVAPSPHFKSHDTTASVMLDVIIALMPAAFASLMLFGMRALLLEVVCIVSCVVFEALFNKVMGRKQTIGDLSAVVTGLLLAYNLPPQLPVYMAVIGCFVAIVIAKQLFGGIGNNFANPAILARVVMLVSFSQAMTTWSIPVRGAEGGVDLVSGATPLASITATGSVDGLSYMDLFIGLGKGGCIGEVCGAALLIGFVYLLFRRVITATTPVVYVGTVFLFSMILGQDPVAHLLSGGLLLGAIFMATDYSTSPTTEKGKFIFAIGCGLLTVIIRVFGSYPEGVSFAILLMNILTPHIDNLTKTKPFGGVKHDQ